MGTPFKVPREKSSGKSLRMEALLARGHACQRSLDPDKLIGISRTQCAEEYNGVVLCVAASWCPVLKRIERDYLL